MGDINYVPVYRVNTANRITELECAIIGFNHTITSMHNEMSYIRDEIERLEERLDNIEGEQ